MRKGAKDQCPSRLVYILTARESRAESIVRATGWRRASPFHRPLPAYPHPAHAPQLIPVKLWLIDYALNCSDLITITTLFFHDQLLLYFHSLHLKLSHRLIKDPGTTLRSSEIKFMEDSFHA